MLKKKNKTKTDAFPALTQEVCIIRHKQTLSYHAGKKVGSFLTQC